MFNIGTVFLFLVSAVWVMCWTVSVSKYSVDHVGRVVRINYNNATRDSVLDFPLDKVQHFYASLKAYVELMTQPENVVTYTMKPGESGSVCV